ncbi:MAG TPA: hypothetical protein VGE08_04705 [Steroidobacter sp.]|uniref:hypothetical protein n=1 Tax=Steroidobacter sp. TaxID=1978227 RepID=UPI002ED9E363
MRKRTDAAKRAARTRRLKRVIAARIAQARHDAFEDAIRSVAAENPAGRLGAFERWFKAEWMKTGGTL